MKRRERVRAMEADVGSSGSEDEGTGGGGWGVGRGAVGVARGLELGNLFVVGEDEDMSAVMSPPDDGVSQGAGEGRLYTAAVRGRGGVVGEDGEAVEGWGPTTPVEDERGARLPAELGAWDGARRELRGHPELGDATQLVEAFVARAAREFLPAERMRRQRALRAVRGDDGTAGDDASSVDGNEHEPLGAEERKALEERMQRSLDVWNAVLVKGVGEWDAYRGSVNAVSAEELAEQARDAIVSRVGAKAAGRLVAKARGEGGSEGLLFGVALDQIRRGWIPRGEDGSAAGGRGDGASEFHDVDCSDLDAFRALVEQRVAEAAARFVRADARQELAEMRHKVLSLLGEAIDAKDRIDALCRRDNETRDGMAALEERAELQAKLHDTTKEILRLNQQMGATMQKAKHDLDKNTNLLREAVGGAREDVERWVHACEAKMEECSEGLTKLGHNLEGLEQERSEELCRHDGEDGDWTRFEAEDADERRRIREELAELLERELARQRRFEARRKDHLSSMAAREPIERAHEELGKVAAAWMTQLTTRRRLAANGRALASHVAQHVLPLAFADCERVFVGSQGKDLRALETDMLRADLEALKINYLDLRKQLFWKEPALAKLRHDIQEKQAVLDFAHLSGDIGEAQRAGTALAKMVKRERRMVQAMDRLRDDVEALDADRVFESHGGELQRLGIANHGYLHPEHEFMKWAETEKLRHRALERKLHALRDSKQSLLQTPAALSRVSTSLDVVPPRDHREPSAAGTSSAWAHAPPPGQLPQRYATKSQAASARSGRGRRRAQTPPLIEIDFNSPRADRAVSKPDLSWRPPVTPIGGDNIGTNEDWEQLFKAVEDMTEKEDDEDDEVDMRRRRPLLQQESLRAAKPMSPYKPIQSLIQERDAARQRLAEGLRDA